MDNYRAVLVSNQETKKYGSGYLIRENLILTARHTILNGKSEFDDGLEYELRFYDELVKNTNIYHRSVVCWQSDTLDIVLLKSETITSNLEKPINDIKFGSLSEDTDFDVEGMGFPEFQEITDKRADTYRLRGKIDTAMGARRAERENRLTLEVTSLKPPLAKQWSGISGTSVFSGEYLVGVVLERSSDEDMGPQILRVVQVDKINDKEFCNLVFDQNKPISSITLPIPDNHSNTSDGDSIIDEGEQDEYTPISVDEFIGKIDEYNSFSDYPEEYSEKCSILDEISSNVWLMILEKSDSKIRSELRKWGDGTSNLAKIIKPLWIISTSGKLTTLDIVDFFEVGENDENFFDDNHGYSRLFRKLIVYLLYHDPSLLYDVKVIERLRKLSLTSNLYWMTFLVDIYLRYKCGNIKIVDDELIQVINCTCEQYRRTYPSKPIVKLWDLIIYPLTAINSYKSKEDVFSTIKESAEKSEKSIELKWCIAAASRILPLCGDDYSSDFIRSLLEIEEGSIHNLVIKSPQFQYFYLKILLREYVYTKNIQHLIDYENQFVKVHKILSHFSASHLQMEYSCSLMILCQSLSEENYLDKFSKLKLYKFANSRDNLLKCNLLSNYLQAKINTKQNLSVMKKDGMESFLHDYISSMYLQYGERIIKFNHLAIREFPALDRTSIVKEKVSKSILESLNRCIDSDNLYEDSFYAKSTPMLAHIKRQDNISLIEKYVTRAMKADKYSLARNARDIIWGLYSCYYYSDTQSNKDEIQSLAAKFGLDTDIVDDKENIKNPLESKIHWSYYAGIKWNEQEQEFIKALHSIDVSESIYAPNFQEEEKIIIPDEIFTVADKYSMTSIFAATLNKYRNSSDLWNIIGTTIMVNRSTAPSPLKELEKAARCYAIARVFAVEGKNSVKKYCFNYIKCRSILINESKFIGREDNSFVYNAAWYLSNPKNNASSFAYRKECIEDYLLLLQKHWTLFDDRTYKQLTYLLRCWVNKDILCQPNSKFGLLHENLSRINIR